MARALVRRLGAALVVLLLVLTATFVLLHLAPGDPSILVGDPRLPAAQREALRSHWGLDQPLAEQYLRWVGHAARGDWGISFHHHRPAGAVVFEALPNTLLLGGAALLVQLLVGAGIGAASARRAEGWADSLLRVASLTLYSIPTFWLALMAILLFAHGLQLFPSSHLFGVGVYSLPPFERFLDLLHHLALPALVLGLSAAGGLARYVRAGLLETGSEGFVLAARARGLAPARILWLHTFRPSLGPLVQVTALSLPALLSGALVTEVVFAWPGLGRIAYQAMLGRDYPLVLACAAWSAFLVVAATALADGLHAALDPRARRHG